MQCLKCSKEFGSEEALRMHTDAKHPKPFKEPLLSDKAKRRLKRWSIAVLIISVVLAIPLYISFTSKTFPPTDARGHVEAVPPSHIMREPIGLLVQKHLLEHADGSGPPGIIINYNCNDFECEEGLIENLESFGKRYPSNVYVAPFPRMDAKVALTKHNRIEVLESFDEKRIDGFIRFG